MSERHEWVEDSPRAVKCRGYVHRPGLYLPRKRKGRYAVLYVARFFESPGGWRAQATTPEGERLTPKVTTLAKNYVRTAGAL